MLYFNPSASFVKEHMYCSLRGIIGGAVVDPVQFIPARYGHIDIYSKAATSGTGTFPGHKPIRELPHDMRHRGTHLQVAKVCMYSEL